MGDNTSLKWSTDVLCYSSKGIETVVEGLEATVALVKVKLNELEEWYQQNNYPRIVAGVIHEC